MKYLELLIEIAKWSFIIAITCLVAAIVIIILTRTSNSEDKKYRESMYRKLSESKLKK